MATRIAVLTGSSASGMSCMRNLLMKTTHNDTAIIIRGCFRSQDKADAVLSDLAAGNDKKITVESMVGLDAENMDSLATSLQDVDRAMIVTPLDYSAGLQADATKSINMIRAAKDAGVKRVVHVGSWTVNAPDALPILSPRFVPTEEYLKSEIGKHGGMEWTVLRGGYFAGNFSHVHGPTIKESGQMLSVPDCKIPPVDVQDIGEAAATLLLMPSDDYKYHEEFVECCGPRNLSHFDIAAELQAGTGRPISFPAPAPALADWTSKNPVMRELYQYMADPKQPGVPSDCTKFQSILGRPPTSLRQWAIENKESFI